MLLWFILVLELALPWPAGAESSQDCVNCPVKVSPRPGKAVKAIGQVATATTEAYPQIVLPLGKHDFAKACRDRFIDENGDIQEWGKAWLTAIQKVDPKCFFEDLDVSLVCPNFHSEKFRANSNLLKKYFLVWAAASIAMKESSCRPNAQAQGVYDTADGMYQLEYSSTARRKAGRDRRYCPYEGVDSQSITFQSECAVSIVTDVNCGRGPTGPIAWGKRGGYWEKLNSQNGGIAKLMRKFPGCN